MDANQEVPEVPKGSYRYQIGPESPQTIRDGASPQYKPHALVQPDRHPQDNSPLVAAPPRYGLNPFLTVNPRQRVNYSQSDR